MGRFCGWGAAFPPVEALGGKNARCCGAACLTTVVRHPLASTHTHAASPTISPPARLRQPTRPQAAPSTAHRTRGSDSLLHTHNKAEGRPRNAARAGSRAVLTNARARARANPRPGPGGPAPLPGAARRSGPQEPSAPAGGAQGSCPLPTTPRRRRAAAARLRGRRAAPAIHAAEVRGRGERARERQGGRGSLECVCLRVFSASNSVAVCVCLRPPVAPGVRARAAAALCAMPAIGPARADLPGFNGSGRRPAGALCVSAVRVFVLFPGIGHNRGKNRHRLTQGGGREQAATTSTRPATVSAPAPKLPSSLGGTWWLASPQPVRPAFCL